MSDTRLLAIDWGTSSARVYELDARGVVVRERRAALGIQRITDGRFADALATLCGDALSQAVPVLACGMIGSRQGWVEAPYCDCPAGIDAIAGALTAVPGTALLIAPGLMVRDAAGVADVMRGEETQILGALPDRPVDQSLYVLPGTHSKWAIAGAEGILTFTTFMTGELYAVLRDHSILGRLAVAGVDNGAFDRGVRMSLREQAALTHDLFSARTLPLTSELASEGVGDYLSGLLVGAEISAARAWAAGNSAAAAGVTLVGEAALCERYRRALTIAGVETVQGSPVAAARGLWRIAQHAGMLPS
ncbi:MAG: 2-dehydro-3-deoxygalactonokinase [Betaproteobacteria bacterium]|nr:MAG: 2-dehydro-3-deoxygalactonokinase [Betaproteobacteria bacterium]